MEASTLPVALALPRRRAATLRAPALLAWILGAVALLLLRDGGVPLAGTVWAEDATVFVQGALHHGLAGSLTEPYAGYLHVPARVLAEIAVLFPPERWALVLAVMSATVTALFSAYVFAASAAMLESRWARAIAAALPVLVGVGWEVPGAICNLHWHALYAAFWALLARPTGRRGIAAAALVVTWTALSDPLVGLMLPLALVQARGLAGSWSRRLAIVAPMGAALALQATTTLTQTRPERFSAFRLSDVAAIYGERVAGGALLGDEWFQGLWHAWGWDAVWGALEAAVVLVALAARLTRGRRRRLVLVAAAASVTYLVVPLALRGTAGLAPQLSAAGGLPEGPVAGLVFGSRYMLFPALALLLCVVAALDTCGGVRARAAFTAVVAVVAVSNLGLVTGRTEGPAWGAEVRQARAVCAAGAAEAFAATPPADAVPWGVSIPCRRLTAY
jgi:hypothetical protein